jgi:hypothetical protein
MALQDVINCAPFRLPQPRPLTDFEWNLIGDAMTFYTSQSGDTSIARALIPAIQAQSCSEWKTSAFGPAPAVNRRAYMALARWFATLDPTSKQNALNAIVQNGLLCQPNSPWAAFDPASDPQMTQLSQVVAQVIQSMPASMVPPSALQVIGPLTTEKIVSLSLWEGAAAIPGPVAMAQVNSGNLEPCGRGRVFTGYIPVSGQDLLRFVSAINGGASGAMVPGWGGILAQAMPGLPPFLAPFLQNVQLPPQLASQTFLVGLELNPGVIQAAMDIAFGGRRTPVTFQEIFSNVALIWAPGQGADIRGLFRPDGTIDAAQVAILVQTMMPTLAPAMLPGIMGNVNPAAIPGLAQALPGIAQAMPGIFGAMTSILGGGAPKPMQGFGGLNADGSLTPHTPPTTGVPIVDQPIGSDKPAGPVSGEDSGNMGVWVGAGIAVAIGALLLAWATSSRD